MSSVVIAGTPPSGDTALPVASTIDLVNDYLPIYTASATATQAINRNTLLNLSSQPVGLTDSQTLTNKTLTSPTISSPTLSGTTAGTFTLGGTITFPSSVVSLTGTQTLTNKTLTSPTINSPTITNASITVDAVTGYTTSNSGTIYSGITVTTGNVALSGTLAVTGNSTFAGTLGVTGVLTPTGGLATNSVSAAALATSAVYLGYTQITTDFSTTSTSATQVTSLTATVTIPAGSRKTKITVWMGAAYNSTTADGVAISIWDGTVGSGTQLAEADGVSATGAYPFPLIAMAIVTPSAGSKTYNVGIKPFPGGTAHTNSGTTLPSFILVEAL